MYVDVSKDGWTVVECWKMEARLTDESGWLKMSDDSLKQEVDGWWCVFVQVMMCVHVYVFLNLFNSKRYHSHLQDSLELLQFRFFLLDLTVVVLAEFDQQQAGDIQHFLETHRKLPLNLTVIFNFTTQTKHTQRITLSKNHVKDKTRQWKTIRWQDECSVRDNKMTTLCHP